MSPNLHPMLNVAVKAARAAGAVVNRSALDLEALRISQKQLDDFTAQASQSSEQAIVETLLTAYPGHAIFAQDSVHRQGAKDSEFVWIIDPLNGTSNFIHGLPVYCISVALSVRGKIEQAVIFDPTRNDLFTATRGRGAYCNSRRLRVAKRLRLQEALVSCSASLRSGPGSRAQWAALAEVAGHCAEIRRSGSAALDLAYLAAGFSDAFFDSGLQTQDLAAGSLLVTEAGGLIGNYSGEAQFLEQAECLAGNPKIFAQLVSLLGKYSRFASAAQKASVRRTLTAAPLPPAAA